jgi:hypothetical protein
MYDYNNAKKKSKFTRGLISTQNILLAAPARIMSSKVSYDFSVLGDNSFQLRARAQTRRIRHIFENSALDETREADFENAAFLAVVKSNSLWHMQSPYKKRQIETLLTTPAPTYKDLHFVTTYGVEEEFFGLNRLNLALLNSILVRTSPDWVLAGDDSIIPTDGTIGRELVSPILTEKNAQRLHSVTSLINGLGGRADLPCALHIHAGIKNTFVSEAQTPIVKQIIFNYMAIEGMLPEIKSNLVRPYGDVNDIKIDFQQWADQIEKYDSFYFVREKLMPFGRRESKINLNSLGIIGTAEFREHPGSVNPQVVFLWLKFIDDLISVSCDMLQGSRAHLPNEQERAALCVLVDEFRQASGFEQKDEMPKADFFERMAKISASDEMKEARQKRKAILDSYLHSDSDSRSRSGRRVRL